jgi:hypothetical protein
MVSPGRACSECHIPGGATKAGGWRGTTFVHPTTPFALTGAHADTGRVSCNDCHQSPKPSGTPPRGYDARTITDTNCIDCHRDVFASAEPSHATFPTDCRLCHSTDAFPGARQHPESNFPLADTKHKDVGCAECHDVARGAPTGGANTDCAHCHGWSGGMWKATPGGEPLDRRHASVAGLSVCAPSQAPAPPGTCFPNGAQVTANLHVCRNCHPFGLP